MSQSPPFLLIGALAQSLVNFRAPLLRGLRAAGCEVHAAAAAVEEDGALVERLRAMGVEPHSVPIDRAGMNPLTDLKTLLALVRLMRRVRPAAVLSYTIKPVIWGTFAAWLTGVPRRYAMITGLGYAFVSEDGGRRAIVQRLLRTLYRIALTRTHKVIFQNPDDLALFRDLGIIARDKPVMLVNGSGVDLAHYTPHPLPEGPLRFLMIARLLGDKGVREYAAAAAAVRRAHPQASFHLVGGLDPNPAAIGEGEIRGWTDAGHLVWHGPQADVRPFLRDAHVIVLPSYREGTPRTVLEAMATARPIITSDAPGCRETVADGVNGFLVPPRSSEALTEAMLRFVATPSIIGGMAERSLEMAREKYCAERVTAAMLEGMDIVDRAAA